VSGHNTPRPHFTPGKDPVPIIQEAGWVPGPVRTGGKSRPHQYERYNLSISSCKDPIFTILIKLQFGQLIVVKIPSCNLYYNPSSGKWFVACGQTEKKKLTDAFCRFSKEPKCESERGWIELLQDRVRFHVFVNTITKFQLCYKGAEYTDWLSKILKKFPALWIILLSFLD